MARLDAGDLKALRATCRQTYLQVAARTRKVLMALDVAPRTWCLAASRLDSVYPSLRELHLLLAGPAGQPQAGPGSGTSSSSGSSGCGGAGALGPGPAAAAGAGAGGGEAAPGATGGQRGSCRGGLLPWRRGGRGARGRAEAEASAAAQAAAAALAYRNGPECLREFVSWSASGHLSSIALLDLSRCCSVPIDRDTWSGLVGALGTGAVTLRVPWRCLLAHGCERQRGRSAGGAGGGGAGPSGSGSGGGAGAGPSGAASSRSGGHGGCKGGAAAAGSSASSYSSSGSSPGTPGSGFTLSPGAPPGSASAAPRCTCAICGPSPLDASPVVAALQVLSALRPACSAELLGRGLPVRSAALLQQLCGVPQLAAVSLAVCGVRPMGHHATWLSGLRRLHTLELRYREEGHAVPNAQLQPVVLAPAAAAPAHAAAAAVAAPPAAAAPAPPPAPAAAPAPAPAPPTAFMVGGIPLGVGPWAGAVAAAAQGGPWAGVAAAAAAGLGMLGLAVPPLGLGGHVLGGGGAHGGAAAAGAAAAGPGAAGGAAAAAAAAALQAAAAPIGPPPVPVPVAAGVVQVHNNGGPQLALHQILRALQPPVPLRSLSLHRLNHLLAEYDLALLAQLPALEHLECPGLRVHTPTQVVLAGITRLCLRSDRCELLQPLVSVFPALVHLEMGHAAADLPPTPVLAAAVTVGRMGLGEAGALGPLAAPAAGAAAGAAAAAGEELALAAAGGGGQQLAGGDEAAGGQVAAAAAGGGLLPVELTLTLRLLQGLGELHTLCIGGRPGHGSEALSSLTSLSALVLVRCNEFRPIRKAVEELRGLSELRALELHAVTGGDTCGYEIARLLRRLQKLPNLARMVVRGCDPRLAQQLATAPLARLCELELVALPELQPMDLRFVLQAQTACRRLAVRGCARLERGFVEALPALVGRPQLVVEWAA